MLRPRTMSCALVFLAIGSSAAARIGAPPPECSVGAWPQPRQSSCATASSSDESAPPATTVGRLALAWSRRLAAPVGNPIAVNGHVYVVVGRLRPRLDALDLATGRYIWSAIAGAPGQFAPVIDGDVLLRLSALNWLRRYDPRGGRILWRHYVESDPEGGSETQQVAADGNWYSSQGEQLVAYELNSGKPRWTRPLRCFACSIAAAAGRVYAAGATSDGGRGALYALDAVTGRTIWSARGAAEMTTASSPLLVGDEIVVATSENGPGEWKFSIEAFSAADGKPIWRTPIGSAPGFSPDAAAAAGDGVFAYASTDGFLYALDVATGAIRWKVRVDTDRSDPAIAGGLVWIVTGDDRLAAFSVADGRRLWTGPTIDGLSAGSPIVAGRFVLVGSSDGRMFAYAAPPP